MNAICGADCSRCGFGKDVRCRGCRETRGCPFGKPCFVAQYLTVGGKDGYEQLIRELIAEFNALGIEGMPEITELAPINGAYINLAYPLPGGKTVKFLDDAAIYLATQVECAFSDGETCRCFGLVADTTFLMVSEYGENGAAPELIAYRKR